MAKKNQTHDDAIHFGLLGLALIMNDMSRTIVEQQMTLGQQRLIIEKSKGL
jgi:hypothetical protein